MHVLYIFKSNGEIVKKVNAELDEAVRESYIPDNKFTWLDIISPNDEEIHFLEEKMKIHSLEIEDALDVEDQNPKFHETRNHLFVTFLSPVIKNGEVDFENLAFFVFKRMIITIRDKDYSLFNKTIGRIYKKAKIIKDRTAVMHIFLDVIIDELLLMADKLDDEINELEKEIFERFEESLLERLYTLKIKIITLRKSIISQKEIIYMLTKQSKFISEKQVVYFKDLYEHVNVLINNFDIFRDSTNTILQLYLSLSSQSTNEVMRVLTVITSIFLPLTLITGIYGMNFKHIPELEFKYAYYVVLTIMSVIALTLLYIYKKKGWI